jgi:nucleoside-diphosphate-sugar epimerase
MSTVLVTGAMGQVGKRVTQLLLDRGRTVVALDLRNPATEKVARSFRTGSGSLVPAYVDLLDADGLTALLAEHRPEAILHLAAAVAPLAYEKPQLARRVNRDGTANLLAAAVAQGTRPLFVEASSASVYGSRNPHTHADRLTAATPTNPIDCYGEDKVAAERLVAASGLPHASLRLGGIISPDLARNAGPAYDVMRRAFPGDQRIHAVDARDVALAFANAADRGAAIDGKVLLIGGDESFVLVQQQLEDDMLAAMGLGRLGADAALPGDPADERGWGLTDWFDTAEAQSLLDFQAHSWTDTCRWVASEAVGPVRFLLPLVAPLIRALMRRKRRTQDRADGRGRYADPWHLMGNAFGPDILAPTTW